MAYVTLLLNGLKIQINMGVTLVDMSLYQCLVGKFILLTPRHDLSYSINLANRFMCTPQEPPMQAMKFKLLHVKSFFLIGHFYKQGEESTLTRFSDANWLGCQDDGKSTGTFVYEICKVQTIVGACWAQKYKLPRGGWSSSLAVPEGPRTRWDEATPWSDDHRGGAPRQNHNLVTLQIWSLVHVRKTMYNTI